MVVRNDRVELVTLHVRHTMCSLEFVDYTLNYDSSRDKSLS